MKKRTVLLQKRIEKFKKIDLYPVTCEALSNGRSNIEILKNVIAGGAKIIQLREKELCKRELYEQALIFRKLTKEKGLLLIINDHLDIALAVDADGVHLGRDDLPTEAARRIAPECIIGRSTHSLEQALKEAEDGADYINIGPIFHTGTKEHETALGVEIIRQVRQKVKAPFTVMGGINAENIKDVLKCGAERIAMVSCITASEDIAAQVKELRKVILEHKK
ncbi:thiamine phosphate synthase [Spirochaetota bacterium]